MERLEVRDSVIAESQRARLVFSCFGRFLGEIKDALSYRNLTDYPVDSGDFWEKSKRRFSIPKILTKPVLRG